MISLQLALVVVALAIDVHQIEFVDELPKTVTGKILRRELRVAEAAKTSAQKGTQKGD